MVKTSHKSYKRVNDQKNKKKADTQSFFGKFFGDTAQSNNLNKIYTTEIH